MALRLARRPKQAKAFTDLDIGNDDRGGDQFLSDQSHQGTLLERGNQWGGGGAGHDHYDAYDGQRRIMGKFPVHDGLKLVGWMSTGVMAAAAIAQVVTALI